MKAVIPVRAGEPDVLELITRDIPKPARNQVLIRVAAAGINRHDLNQRVRGYGPAGSTDVLGLEVSGHVVALGPDGDQSLLDRPVAALVDGGGYAEYVIADVDLLFHWPEALSAVEAAALPEALFTLQLNLVDLAQLQGGDWLLIHGGTSGIGMTGIPFANQKGAKVVVTAGSDEKCDRCLSRGALAAINYRTRDFVEEVKTLTGGRGVDVILDTVGGLYARRNLAALAPDGRITHLSPAAPEYNVPLNEIMVKRAHITGALLRAYPLARKALLAKAIREQLWPEAIRSLRPVIDRVYTLETVRDAHRRMDEGVHIGKVMLTMEGAAG
jgi:putative PIG3 family NAD(P)H quinone oxidoreductase